MMIGKKRGKKQLTETLIIIDIGWALLFFIFFIKITNPNEASRLELRQREREKQK